MTIRDVTFTGHAEKKIGILRSHGVILDKETVKNTVINPDATFKSRKGRVIAQKRLDEKHVLRVIYEQEGERARVITFYPGRRSRYEIEL